MNDQFPFTEYIWKLKRMATFSPCAQDQRAAAVIAPAPFCAGRAMAWQILGTGYNRPPGGRTCDRSQGCRALCAKGAIHAEALAIRNAQMAIGMVGNLSGAHLVHVRLGDDEDGIAFSRAPRCIPCARDALENQVSWIWLFHKSGWTKYSADAFFDQSCQARAQQPFARKS